MMSNRVSKNITSIIFDLGGVLFDIDYALTQKAFINLGFKEDFNELYSQKKQSGLFDDFEKGSITPAQFRKHLIPRLNIALKRMYNGNKAIPAGGTMGILDAIVDLENWMERIHHLEEDLNLQRGQWVTEMAKKARVPAASGTQHWWWYWQTQPTR